MSKVRNIPSEITEMMSYLAYSFFKSMKSSVYDKDDLQQDLVVLYLEKYNPSYSKDFWFTVFKNYLLNRYAHTIIERKAYEKIKKAICNYPHFTKEALE